jgi:tetratricopeptide (TPR) repeat protein
MVALDLLSLALRRWSKVRWLEVGVVAVGLVGVFALYETGEHGGALVYSYAGGVGTRTGDPKDVEHLLTAGLYQQALLDRTAGRPDDAAALIEQAARRYPANVDLQLLAAESLLLDRKDPRASLAALDRMTVPTDSRILRARHASLRADAFEATGQRDAAIAALQPVVEAFPTNMRLKQRLEQLKAAR